MISFLLGLALMAAPQDAATVDYRNPVQVEQFLAQIGASRNITKSVFFITPPTAGEPPFGSQWIVLSAEPEGVNMVYRRLERAPADGGWFARVRLERFTPATIDGAVYASRATEYELRCKGDKRVRLRNATDYRDRDLAGPSLRVKAAERPWMPADASPVASLVRAFCPK